MSNFTKLLPRRVLVIDDNADAAETLVSVLSMLGHTAAAANDGKSGLALAASFNPDVIFLDIGMPGMNGFDVAIALRKIPGFEQKRIVALTGWRDDETRARAFQSGFDVHLTKPAALAKIEELVDSAA